MKKSRVLAVVGLAVLVLVLIAVFMRVPPLSTSGGGSAPTTTSSPGTSTSPQATTAPTAGELESLSGTVVSLGGDVITAQLWSRMRDYNVSDPAIEPYIEWLRNALAPDPSKALNVPWYPRYYYWWFNDGIYYYVKLGDAIRAMDTGGWAWTLKNYETDAVLCTGKTIWNTVNGTGLKGLVCFIPPLNDTIVRTGLVKLPFGAGLIVTAYQTGNGVTVVVHGTIINETGWRELLARTAVFMGYNTFRIKHYGDTYEVAYDAETIAKTINSTRKVDWVLWRIALRGQGSYLDVDGRKLPIRQVLVLLEMPVYSTYKDFWGYWWQLEIVYWDVVAHPALALAVHLAYPGDTNILKLYTKLVKTMTLDVVLTGVKHPGNILEDSYFTPFLIRRSGRGVCNEQSRSTSLFATNALGAYTAYIIVNYIMWGGNIGHAISLLMYPTGWKDIDVDRDSRGEAEIIVDTANLGVEYINKNIRFVHYEPPLLYVDPHVAYEDESVARAMRYAYFYIGVVDAVTSLPEWLRAPWLGYAMEKSNFTGIGGEAWRSARNYSALFSFVDYMRRAVDDAKSSPLYSPPSMALALGTVLKSLPVVYAGATPVLKHIEGAGTRPSVTTTPAPSNSTPSTPSSTPTSTPVPKPRPRVVEARIVLVPVYWQVHTPWGRLPVFHHYAGSVFISTTNVTVIARPWDSSSYYVTVYVNGSRAYYTYEPVALPAKLGFRYRGVNYVVEAETPQPPVLNQTIDAVLEPVNNITYPLPNGTRVNITIYQVNQTIKIGNTTIVIYGYVSRLRIDIDIYVYGVPPANYSVDVEGINVSTTIDYQGALHIRTHYHPPQRQLIPETSLEITIQSLNLTITIPIER